MALSGTMNIPGEDFGASVDVVDIDVNGSTVYVTYVVSGNLKVKAYTTVQNVDGTLPIIMSGCTVS